MADSRIVTQDRALERSIGVPQLAAATINCTIGAGIFVLPAVAAQVLGPSAPFAFVACALLMLLVVTTFALAATRVAVSGGVYAYTEVAFGPFVGFLAGALQWVSFVLAVAAVSSALLDQATLIAPMLSSPLPRALALAIIFAALAALNIRGVKIGARVIQTVTAAKLAPLLMFVAAGLFFILTRSAGAVSLPAVPQPHALGDAVLLLIFAFEGIEVAVTPGGELRDPSRTVPRAVLLALAVTTTLYIAIQIVAGGLLGDGLRGAASPLASAAGIMLGSTGRSLMLAGGVISAFGYLSGDMLSTPRMLFAFARDGFLPRVLASIHPRFHTPGVAIATHAALVTVLAATSGFGPLIVLTNIATLVLYLTCSAAAFQLIRRRVSLNGRPFSFPGDRVVPMLAAAAIAWVLSRATATEWGLLAAVLGIAAALYWLRALIRSRLAPAATAAIS